MRLLVHAGLSVWGKPSPSADKVSVMYFEIVIGMIDGKITFLG